METNQNQGVALTGSVAFDKELYGAPDRDEYVGSIAALDADEADEQEQALARHVSLYFCPQKCTVFKGTVGMGNMDVLKCFGKSQEVEVFHGSKGTSAETSRRRCFRSVSLPGSAWGPAVCTRSWLLLYVDLMLLFAAHTSWKKIPETT
jgi:hypothetical protein